jgi:hypothetical protein
LQKLEKLDMPWLVYRLTEINPLLEAGYIPPVADGFEKFSALPEIAQSTTEDLKHALANEQTDPYDSHPSLKDRLDAVQQADFELQGICSDSAISLLEGAGVDEISMFKVIRPDRERLQPIGWSEVAEKVTVPLWKTRIRENSELLKGLNAESLGSVLADLPSLVSQVVDPKGMLLSADQRRYRAIETFADALSLCLIGAGWSVGPSPGASCLVRGGEKLDAFALVYELIEGQKSSQEWRTTCQELGIEGLSLTSLAEAANTN